MLLRASSLLLLLSLVATACGSGSSSPGAGGLGTAPSGTANSDDNRTLVIAVALEPVTLGGRGLDQTAGNARANLPPLLFNAGLARQDESLTFRPFLAETLPQFGTDSWKVFPDGRMETTWRVRPNLTWHDGAPLGADDFAFSVQARIALMIEGTTGGTTLVNYVDEASAPDPSTLVVKWKKPFPPAGESDWQPLPRHILGPSLEGGATPESLLNLPYWTTEFVGAGPYRLERWERGAFLDGVAFPGYVRGEPKIKHIKLVWISDANIAVANLLSGAVHLAANGALVFQQAQVLKREWAGRGHTGSVLLSPDSARYMTPQFKTEYTNPKAILDVRVRQALAHVIDKQALVDALLDGEPGTADTALSTKVPYFPELDKVLTKYPLDLQRAEQLMSEAGFRKDGDGFYSQNGTRLSPLIQAISDGRGDREATIVADSWKRAGIETPLKIVTPAEARSQEVIATFSAFSITGTATGLVFGSDSIFNKFPTSTISAATNGWIGSNKTGYSDPEYDRLYSIITATLDPSERTRTQVQAEKLLSDQAAYYPLYYAYAVVAYAAGLEGPQSAVSIPDSSAIGWRVEEWHWR